MSSLYGCSARRRKPDVGEKQDKFDEDFKAAINDGFWILQNEPGYYVFGKSSTENKLTRVAAKRAVVAAYRELKSHE